MVALRPNPSAEPRDVNALGLDKASVEAVLPASQNSKLLSSRDVIRW
jgi:hypothetical protein